MIKSITDMPAHLPPSMIDSVKLLPKNVRLILFTRHSLRELSDGNGFASYALPLTPKGRVLAESWGRWLATHLPYSMDVDSISSPIQRCIDTAILMQAGAGIDRNVSHQALLVEPGSLVVDHEEVGKVFKEIGALNFINRFLAEDLAGIKSPHKGGLDLLALFFQHQPQHGHLLLAVSHDTLLSAFLAVMMGVTAIDWDDWPKMMEGVFLWFDDKPFSEAKVHFIWRGQCYERPLIELIDPFSTASYPLTDG
ncbi:MULTISPECIES: histidine phosphatase family protein [unclassified Moraxella]|uniref:histidine phosphatase family protein n=1 Tax=unclassified Moraxella TaxID=2685852 RepID=UPI003AF54CAD